MPASDWSPPSPPRPPSTTTWASPTGAAPPATVASRHRTIPGDLVAALVAAAIGWLIVGFELFMVYVFVGRGESCRANRGDAYQSCVRQEDVTELIFESVAISLSAVALIIVLRSFRRRAAHGYDGALWIAAAAVSLAAVCVGLWIHGSLGGWEPSRPLRYDPIPTTWGHVAMVIGVVIGSVVGALVPRSRQRRHDGS